MAAERVQRGVFHAVDEALGLGFQPGLVDAPGAAHDSIQQPGVEASSLVTGQIDDDGDGPVDPDPRRPPDVLIHPEGLHSGEPGRVSRSGLRLHLDRVPGRMPVHAEMSGQRRDSGVVVAERTGCPCRRPGRQHHPRRRQLVGLTEGLGRTRRFSTAPHPHQPAEHGDPAEARSIMQPPSSAAVAVMIMVSCQITARECEPGKAAREGQRNLRNEVGDSRVAAPNQGAREGRSRLANQGTNRGP